MGHQKKSNSQKKRFNTEAESVPLIHLAPFFIMLSCYCEELYLTQSVIFFQAQTQTKIEPNCRLLGDSCNLRHWHPLLIPSLHSACNIATDCVKVGMLKDTFCVPQRCQQHWQSGSIWHSENESKLDYSESLISGTRSWAKQLWV